MLEILEADKQTIIKNIKILALDYKKNLGRGVCLSCPTDVRYMISSLKQFYKMTDFKFKAERASYKNKRSDSYSISNDTMTNEKAIEFLKTNPERIRLFASFPENWRELIEEPKEVTEAEKAAALAEAAAVGSGNSEGSNEAADELKKIQEGNASEAEKNAEEEALKALNVSDAEEVNASEAEKKAEEGSECCEEEHEGEPCEECKEKMKAELQLSTVKELKKQFPKVYDSGMKKGEFIDAIILVKIQKK